jgi:hypothetical protein
MRLQQFLQPKKEYEPAPSDKSGAPIHMRELAVHPQMRVGRTKMIRAAVLAATILMGELAWGSSQTAQKTGYIFIYRPNVPFDSDSDPTIYFLKSSESLRLAGLAKGEFFALEVPEGIHDFSWTRIPLTREKISVSVRGGDQVFLRFQAYNFTQTGIGEAPPDIEGVSPINRLRVFHSSVLIPKQRLEFARTEPAGTNPGGPPEESKGRATDASPLPVAGVDTRQPQTQSTPPVSLRAIRKVFVAPMDNQLDEYLRAEITKKFKGKLTVVLLKEDADAILVGERPPEWYRSRSYGATAGASRHSHGGGLPWG